MENGLEISSRCFKEFGKIYLMEFIDSDEKLLLIGSDLHKSTPRVVIWDLYNTHKVETIQLGNLEFTKQNISVHLASTSGNLLQVDDKGKVQSILKMIDNIRTLQDDGEGKDASGRIELEEVEENKNDLTLTSKELSVEKIKNHGSGKHIIYFYKDNRFR